MERMTAPVPANELADFRMSQYEKTPDGVTTLIAEPVLGKDNRPSWSVYETPFSADAFTQMEKDLGCGSGGYHYSIGHHNHGGPGHINVGDLWGNTYAGGNAFLIVAGGIEVIAPRVDMSLMHSLIFTNPWHYACVDAKSNAATQRGYQLKPTRRTQRGVSNPELSAFQRFEDRVYARTGMDLSEIFRQVSFDFFSTGNLNLEITRNIGGLIDCVYPVPAVTCYKHSTLPLYVQRVNPIEFNASMGEPEEAVVIPRFGANVDPSVYRELLPERYRAEAGMHEMVMSSNVVLSTDPFYGISDILSALTTLLGDNAANAYNLQFFQNNAIPRYAITVAGGRVTDEFINDIKHFMSHECKQQNHRSIVIPVMRGFEVKFEKLDDRPNDASFLAYKNINKQEIMAVHKVPPAEVGVWDDANRSNAEQQSKNYQLKIIEPHQLMLNGVMNRIIQTGLGLHGVQFQWNKLELTSEKELATIRQTNAIARVSEATATRQMIDSLTKAVEAQVMSTEEAASKLAVLWARYEQLVENIDITEI